MLMYAGKAGHFGPSLERLGLSGAMLGGRKAVATEMERVVGLVVGGEETLCMPG